MADCVGCGYCCIKVPCGVALRLHGNGIEKCPSLSWNGTRYVCGLMIGPDSISKRYRDELHAGAGCCSSLNSWRRDVKPRREQDEPLRKKNPVSLEMQVFVRALSGNFISGDAIWLACNNFKREMVKRGWREEDAREYANQLLNVFRGNVTEFEEGFMPSVPEPIVEKGGKRDHR